MKKSPPRPAPPEAAGPESLPQWIELRAGPLSMVFDPEWAFLRRLRLGGREVLRGIYMPVRDRGWATVPPKVRNIRCETAEDSFRLSFEATCERGEIGFAWTGEVSGAADGTVRFAMRGVARSTFQSNRISLCVLHPIAECVGQPCRVEHPDGSVEESRFPCDIAPHQPFLDIRAMSHEVLAGLWAEVRFEGGVFETEDQRNWTDASFKTYSPPLAQPRPFEVKEGAEVAQSVTLSLKGEVPAEAARPQPRRQEVVVEVGETPVGPLPRIGFQLPAGRRESSPSIQSAGSITRIGLQLPAGRREVDPQAWLRLQELSPAHLRLDLWPSEPLDLPSLAGRVMEARMAGAALELALHLSQDAEAELARLRKLLDSLQKLLGGVRALLASEFRHFPGPLPGFLEESGGPPVRVAAWLVFPMAERATTPRELAELARRILGDFDPAAKLGGGTDRYFTELNRERPPVEALDLVCYSLNPQVHTFDDASLAESLEGQAWTVASARQFAGGRPLAVTPVTLRPRSRAAAGGRGLGEPPPDADPRQATLFGAGWTLGSLKALAESGVHSVTYYETTGWRGLLGTEGEPEQAGRRRSRRVPVFPVYHVFADVGEFAASEVLPTRSSDPLRVTGLALRKGGRQRVMIANLTAQPQDVRVGPVAGTAVLKRLSEANVGQATRSPERFRSAAGETLAAADAALALRLPPHGLARIDDSPAG